MDNKFISEKVIQTLFKHNFLLKSTDMTKKKFWLMKSEPDAYSIRNLETDRTTLWDGIRNYQARNFMRKMNIGDQVFFYHSNCKPPGIIGLMEVIDKNITDPTQFDPSSKYYDPKSNRKEPRWDCVKVKFTTKFKEILSLQELRSLFSEDDLIVVKKGNRLSITPVKEQSAKLLLDNLKI